MVPILCPSFIKQIDVLVCRAASKYRVWLSIISSKYMDNMLLTKYMTKSRSLLLSLSFSLSFSFFNWKSTRYVYLSLSLLHTLCERRGVRQQDTLGSLFPRRCRFIVCCWVVPRCVKYSLTSSLQNTIWISRAISESRAYSTVVSLCEFQLMSFPTQGKRCLRPKYK